MSWYYPTEEQLGLIVYNSSFGLRSAPRAASSTPLIKAGRVATAVVVLNRVRQRVTVAPGWAPNAAAGFARHGTEPAVMRTSPNYALTVRGNDVAFAECRQAAAEARALVRRGFPMDDEHVFHGAQYYGHFDNHPSRHWPRSERAHLVAWYGPMASILGDKYLGVYLDLPWQARALRLESERGQIPFT